MNEIPNQSCIAPTTRTSQPNSITVANVRIATRARKSVPGSSRGEDPTRPPSLDSRPRGPVPGDHAGRSEARRGAAYPQEFSRLSPPSGSR